MNVFFDNCTAPCLAATLNGYISSEGHQAFHIKDVPGLSKGRNSSDTEWIGLLKSDPTEWIFVSGDGRILKNPAERAALRQAGLHGFILSPAYQKTLLNQVAATIVWKWPEIESIVKLLAAPSMHEIPINRLSKMRQLSF